ncbi:MAG: glutamate--cysteine ligase [Alphaproteobacteria bacterium]|nr:glutamate--cysteine ligase [Beijerinckiaceae bacterium]NBQ38631.1 glutamate--cysteine ligase [Alphaproteobacteria bacterium]
MARDISDTTPIESRDELVAYLEGGSKPREKFRIGTEHEKFPFRPGTNEPVPYEGARGIEALLKGMQERLGWDPIFDRDKIIGLFDAKGCGAISLEPGGQYELSGAAVENLHQTAAELDAHLKCALEVGDELGIQFLALGMSPLWTRAETPVMPKGRYAIMTRYMPTVGTRGLDMMYRTSTVQVNLDFSSESDMVKKLRTSVALQPLATALFANSPFTEGEPNGYQSMRSHIWLDTDNDRSGMIPFAFESGMGFDRYVEWALDVPMYFIKRDETYIDVAGTSFRDLLAGKHPALPGEKPVLSDWVNHLSTLFPEVRLKKYLEMRGADAGPVPMLNALPAFWVGLLYDDTALDAAWDMVKHWTNEDRHVLRRDVPRDGLQTSVKRHSLRELAREVLKISRFGLERRAKLSPQGTDETVFLEPLDRIIETGKTQSDELLAHYRGDWKNSVTPVFKSLAYR